MEQMHIAQKTPLAINDLQRHNHELQPQLRAAYERVAAGGWYVLGKEVEAFEQEFARYCGVGHAVGVANGTEAIELALRAMGVESGDAVALVANATASPDSTPIARSASSIASVPFATPTA